ncbi:MAG: hemerythrin domain-containing protein [Burkholderiales bacterium]|nr:hemerythrin domain-containing protein [Burkholderiales bacterium]
MIDTQTGRLLDDEHRIHLALLDRVEQALARATRNDGKLGPLLNEFAHAISHDIERHFGFEEEHVFPRLDESGDSPVAALMRQEHDDIRELALELLPLVRRAAELDADGWDQLRQGTLEMVERQVSHIQKETMAVLPLLNDLLDADADAELAMAYATA